MAPKSSAKAGQKPPAPSSQPHKAKANWKYHKATPKQPLPLPERLKRLFTSLCAQIDGGHFANAVKTCDKILRLDPNDPDARQTKLFLLLQTEQYTAALSLIDESSSSSAGSDPNPNRYAYERAYTLYRLQREADARDVLASLKEDAEKQEEGVQRGVVHLEAQLNYREGAYQAAVDLYNELLDTAEPNSEEHADILTNLTAAQKHLEFINTGFLRALDALPNSITSTLESAPPPVPPSASGLPSSSANAPAPAQPALPEAHPQKPKQPRKSRLPPGVVPGITPPPDPERWIKKSERSTFGAGQGRRRKGAGGGAGGATQGAGGATQGAGGATQGAGPVDGGLGGSGAGAAQQQQQQQSAKTGGGGKAKKRK